MTGFSIVIVYLLAVYTNGVQAQAPPIAQLLNDTRLLSRVIDVIWLGQELSTKESEIIGQLMEVGEGLTLDGLVDDLQSELGDIPIRSADNFSCRPLVCPDFIHTPFIESVKVFGEKFTELNEELGGRVLQEFKRFLDLVIHSQKYPSLIETLIDSIGQIPNFQRPQNLKTFINSMRDGLSVATTFEKSFKSANSTLLDAQDDLLAQVSKVRGLIDNFPNQYVFKKVREEAPNVEILLTRFQELWGLRTLKKLQKFTEDLEKLPAKPGHLHLFLKDFEENDLQKINKMVSNRKGAEKLATLLEPILTFHADFEKVLDAWTKIGISYNMVCGGESSRILENLMEVSKYLKCTKDLNLDPRVSPTYWTSLETKFGTFDVEFKNFMTAIQGTDDGFSDELISKFQAQFSLKNNSVILENLKMFPNLTEVQSRLTQRKDDIQKVMNQGKTYWSSLLPDFEYAYKAVLDWKEATGANKALKCVEPKKAEDAISGFMNLTSSLYQVRANLGSGNLDELKKRVKSIGEGPVEAYKLFRAARKFQKVPDRRIPVLENVERISAELHSAVESMEIIWNSWCRREELKALLQSNGKQRNEIATFLGELLRAFDEIDGSSSERVNFWTRISKLQRFPAVKFNEVDVELCFANGTAQEELLMSLVKIDLRFAARFDAIEAYFMELCGEKPPMVLWKTPMAKENLDLVYQCLGLLFLGSLLFVATRELYWEFIGIGFCGSFQEQELNEEGDNLDWMDESDEEFSEH
ncbi:unnamed protein product [Caenorhabditis sp. 36 PRJEB53466]|nr:unnamed protein product [Caenorhabditis sp. 36 PRJEB53466]